MSTQLIPFQFETFPIRVVMVDDEPWWVAADVCAALEIANNRDALTRLDNDEKGVASTDTLGGKQEMAVINEPGLYSLILGSRKPEAKAFKRWVTHEVIPSIRKTGGYTLPKAQPAHTLADALKLSKEAARVARAFGFDRNMIALSANNLAKTVTGIDVLQHMGATHLIANPKGQTYTPTELGKMLSPPVSAVKLNLLLEASGLQTKEFGHWLPTDKADGLFEWLDTGKRHSDGTPVKQVKWFQAVLAQLPQAKQEAA